VSVQIEKPDPANTAIDITPSGVKSGSVTGDEST